MDRRQRVTANALEDYSHQQLKAWSKGDDYYVIPKMALNQALDIRSSGLTEHEYDFALKASFDFVVARSHDGQVLYAIEVDGYSHRSAEARRRDQKKNSICKKLGMPLIRVGPKSVELKLEQFSSALIWLATLVPLADAIEEAYARGTIPHDEIVFPTDVIGLSTSGMTFPLDPTRPVIDRLWKLCKQGKILGFPTMMHAIDSGYSAGGVVTFALAFVPEGTLMALGGCLAGNALPIPEHDVSDAIALAELERQLTEYDAGLRSPLPPEAVVRVMRGYRWSTEWLFSTNDGKHPSFTFTHTRRNAHSKEK
jgi:hypothetical protein